MDTNDTYQFEDRRYVSPTVSRDEAERFITTLRETQRGANQQIEQDTQMLGTDVPSSQGGLISGAPNENSYFASRYQTPQVNQQVANLRAIVQANALKRLLQNDAAQWQKRYKDAYLDYQKRMNDKSNQPTNNPQVPQTPGDVDEEVTDEVVTLTPPPNITLSKDPQKLLEEYMASHGLSKDRLPNNINQSLRNPLNVVDLKTGGIGSKK